MTENTATMAIDIMKAYFPMDAGRLEGDRGKAFKSVIVNEFYKTEDETFILALKRLLPACKHIPTIYELKEAVRGQNERNKGIPVIEPPKANPLGIAKVKEIIANSLYGMRKAEKREPTEDEMEVYLNELNPELIDYARRAFPYISIKTIYRNSADILEHLVSGGMMDGHRLRMYLDKHGTIQLVAQI